MPLPTSIVQVVDDFVANTMIFAAPFTAGKRVCVQICGSGVASGTMTADVTDDSGTVYTRDWALNTGNVATGTGVVAYSGIVPANGTNATSTITIGTTNFTVVTYRSFEATLAPGAILQVGEFTSASADSASNALTDYDTLGDGSLIVTIFRQFSTATQTFGTTGSTVAGFTELLNSAGSGAAITVCQTDGSDDPDTAVTVDCTFGSTSTKPTMISIAYKLPAGDATSFTATKRQTSVNKNQKGFADIAPSPDGSVWDSPTTITANSTAGTCNFIRSDGVQSAGSITLDDTQTAVMEVFSTQSSSSIVFSWTTNNAAITSPAATSFTVQAIESAFVAVAPSIIWNSSDYSSGFTVVPTASTVAHGTGVSEIAIVVTGDRAPFEYITDTSRTVCVPAWNINPSLIQKQQFYLENEVGTDAFNHKLHSDRAELFGSGFEFPDVDGAYTWAARVIPFNGLEAVTYGVLFYDAGGTLPKITSTASSNAGFYSAFATDPVGRASINALAANTTIVLGGTNSGSQSIPGSWTTRLPFVMKGVDVDTSIITSNTNNWSSIFTIALHVPLVQIENVTYDATNIGQLSASNAQALVFKGVKFRETLEETSKYLAQVEQFSCFNGGVYFINCSGWLVSCEGVSGFQSSGDGNRSGIPDIQVGFDFFFNSSTGYIFSTRVKRFTNPGVEDGIPLSAATTVTVASSAFNVGTNSNLTRIIVTGMPALRGAEYLAYTESVTVSGIVYPIVIGRTDVANGILYAGGDLTSIMTNGVTMQLSACFMQRNHFTKTLTITGATNNHDGTATLTWSDSGQIEQVGGYEQLRFVTTSTTTALRGMAFYVSSVNAGTRTTTVLGELAGSAVAGDLIWMSQRAHADSNQLGISDGASQNTGPVIEMSCILEGFQSLLLQSGDTFAVTRTALIGVVTPGYMGQIQDNASNVIFQNTTWTATIEQNHVNSAANVFINDSIVGNTASQVPPTWNDAVLFTNSHAVDAPLPNGIGNTTGAVAYDSFYNSTTSALQSRVWNTNVAFDLYGNQAVANTYTRLGAVQGDPGEEPIGLTAGVLSVGAVTATTATLNWSNASGGTGTIDAQLQRSAHGANTWVDVAGAISSPATNTGLTTGTIYDYRVAFADDTTTVYSNGLSILAIDAVSAGPPATPGVSVPQYGPSLFRRRARRLIAQRYKKGMLDGLLDN